MPRFYEIQAYSKQLNQTQREFDQDSLQGRPTTSAKLAQQKADALAHRFNLEKKGKAQDWKGRISPVD